jgi:hypothetical protein
MIKNDHQDTFTYVEVSFGEKKMHYSMYINPLFLKTILFYDSIYMTVRC